MPHSILLIDDDPATRDLFRIAADFNGITLAAVEDGESAFNHLERRTPDIIVIDLYLFGTNGFEILQQIRHSDFDPHCPIVATTAYYTSSAVRDVILSGFDAFLPKPINVLNLMPFLHRVILQELDA
ncbi:MAG: response regulator [Anaerolineae bacterium]|nr:response regulator [Anaerolineae bacterium]